MSDSPDGVFKEFNEISSTPWVFTDAPIVDAIRRAYPELNLIISSEYSCNYLGFAAAGQATAVPIDSGDSTTPNLKLKRFYRDSRQQRSSEYQDVEPTFLCLGGTQAIPQS